MLYKTINLFQMSYCQNEVSGNIEPGVHATANGHSQGRFQSLKDKTDGFVTGFVTEFLVL